MTGLVLNEFKSSHSFKQTKDLEEFGCHSWHITKLAETKFFDGVPETFHDGTLTFSFAKTQFELSSRLNLSPSSGSSPILSLDNQLVAQWNSFGTNLEHFGCSFGPWGQGHPLGWVWANVALENPPALRVPEHLNPWRNLLVRLDVCCKIGCLLTWKGKKVFCCY